MIDYSKEEWNCPKYLEDKKNGTMPSSSGIFVIETNLSTSSSWVLDTGCDSHICTNVHELKRSRALAKGEVDLRVRNGAKVAALTVGTYALTLPSGLIIQLENCYYVPVISRNLISVSCLDKFGYSFMIKDKCCSIYLDDIFYANVILSNGLYILDLDMSIYNINTKRIKSNELDKFNYFITFTDDYSRFGYVYLMKHKSE